MGYISELRKFVGHDPLIMVAAAVWAEDEQGRVLMQLRSDTHDWGLPGGAVELGESTLDSARRELLEETGLSCETAELIDVYSGPEYAYVYPNGDQVDTVIILYRMTGISGTLRMEDGESLELRFFDPQSLPAPLEARTETFFSCLREKGRLLKK